MILPKKVADHWLTVKKLMIDSTLADKLKSLAGGGGGEKPDIPLSMIHLMESHFTSQNEWDVSAAGKVLPVAETVCKWITSVEKYFTKEQVSLSNIIGVLSTKLLGSFTWVRMV